MWWGNVSFRLLSFVKFFNQVIKYCKQIRSWGIYIEGFYKDCDKKLFHWRNRVSLSFFTRPIRKIVDKIDKIIIMWQKNSKTCDETMFR